MTGSPIARDHKHASFTQSFIAKKQREGFRLVGCEVMFNYFGDRGVIDVVLRKDYPSERRAIWVLCEIKPDLHDIGEAIRQVRRAEQYFCRARPDLRVKDWENEYEFVLVLEASKQNLLEVLDLHRDLFKGVEVMYHHEDPAKIDELAVMEEIVGSSTEFVG
jgi:hypothetical protein